MQRLVPRPLPQTVSSMPVQKDLEEKRPLEGARMLQPRCPAQINHGWSPFLVIAGDIGS